jgi:radical SAM protein with 4Fe4S-binding SPASM domain
MNNVILQNDVEYFNDLKRKGDLDVLYTSHQSFQAPGDWVLAISNDSFLRKDKTQIVFYGRAFLDVWANRLSPEQAVIICLFDGQRTIDDVSLLVQKYCEGSKELNDYRVRSVLDFVGAFGNPPKFIIRNEKPSTPYRTYTPQDFYIPEGQTELSVDLDKPIAILWMPTSVCQTDCIYCYATRRSISQSNLLSDKRVKELFDEGAELGICKVNVDGGDALCRKNVTELFAYANSLDITIDLSTKAYVSKDLAKELYDSGIRLVQFGFDAPVPDLFDKVVGRKGHFYKTIESIHNCVDAGIRTRTNSIIIQETAPYIHELISFLHTLPTFDMKIAPAFRTAHRHMEGLLLPESQKKWLKEQIEILKQEYPAGKIKFECRSDFMELNEEGREKAFKDWPRCGVGREVIVITPDGKVVMCEQSPHDPEMVVGDVRDRSMLDVWQSEEMHKFKYVSRDRFKNTPCYDCEDFRYCMNLKGGCIINTIKAYGTRFAPNPVCSKAPKYDIPLT